MKDNSRFLDLKKEHLIRYKKAKQKPISFMLFDIDHNIVDSESQLPNYMIKEITRLINEKGIGIGFVSGRPRKASIPNGQDINSILDKILPLIDCRQYTRIMIFPEYAGYGFNIGNEKLYDYGFVSSFEKHKQSLIKDLKEKNYEWLDFIEYKCTSISLWIKPSLCNTNFILQRLDDINLLLKHLNLDKDYIAIDGAHRTIDILHRKVNKVRAIEEISKIYNIPTEKIATSDDQANYEEGGYLFTDHPLGFATDSFYNESSMQISTKLIFNEIGIGANMKLLQELSFQPLEIN